MKIAVYSAIFGGRDVPLVQPRGDYDFHLFTDADCDLPGVVVHRGKIDPGDDPCRVAKRFKVLPHVCLPEYDLTLWIDGSMRLKPDANKIITAGTATMAVCAHRYCRCIYDAANELRTLALDEPAVMMAQTERYKAENYPAKRGMAECGIILRRNDPRVNAFNEHWFEEIRRGSRRDQLSFDYVAWKLGLSYTFLSGTVLDNSLCEFVGHAN